MTACARMRGLRSATRYQEGLKSASLNLRPPRPDPHAHPVHHLVGPDPADGAPVDVDLAHALHARAQLLDAACNARFYTEEVASFLDDRHWRDLLDDERQWVARHAGERKCAGLADRDVGDVALVDFHDHAV